MIDIEKLVGKVSDEIKKGSTRLVYFPINPRKIILDGIDVEIETVLKVAKSHTLELNSGECDLGKCQNRIEFALNSSKYTLFAKNSNLTYTTNNTVLLSTIINSDPNNNWIEMIKVNQLTPALFNEITATEIYYCGLGFIDVQNCFFRYYTNMHKAENEQVPSYIDDDKYFFIIEHPWVKMYLDFMKNFNLVPFDFTLKNLGYIEHPISKNKIILLCDYGFTEEYNKFFDLVEENA
jgi:hypothetical protein